MGIPGQAARKIAGVCNDYPRIGGVGSKKSIYYRNGDFIIYMKICIFVLIKKI